MQRDSDIVACLIDPTAIPVVVFCLYGAAYVIIRHKANIKRLMDGTEPRIGQMGDLPAEAK